MKDKIFIYSIEIQKMYNGPRLIDYRLESPTRACIAFLRLCTSLNSSSVRMTFRRMLSGVRPPGVVLPLPPCAVEEELPPGAVAVETTDSLFPKVSLPPSL